MMRDAAALGVVYDVNEGGLWCMETGIGRGSVMHVKEVYDVRCGSLRAGL